jgi:hypothetical protein
MALTGRADGPAIGPPAGLVSGLSDVAADVERTLERMGASVKVDALQHVVERAALAGFRRQGAVSCGGASRLFRTEDGWIAVSLPRVEDLEAVPAWLETEVPDGESVWDTVSRVSSRRATSTLVERGTWLGLALGALPGTTRPSDRGCPIVVDPSGASVPKAGRTSLRGLVVVDLSSLWAGPLCSHLLRLGGAEVIKVESKSRPDGARRAPGRFFDALNAGKKMVALDFDDDRGDLKILHRLVERADVVIESTRPRALRQHGFDADAVAASGPRPKVWLSITGHGRTDPGAMRVAFGDDAAVAGGLVVFDAAGPCFCADAIADPATGLYAARAALELLAAGCGGVVDVAMSRVAAALSGPTIESAADVPIAPPKARVPIDTAGELGRDTNDVVSALQS